jgi:hypothetical protein
MRAEGQIWPSDRNVVFIKLQKIFCTGIDISEIHYKRYCVYLILTSNIGNTSTLPKGLRGL